MARLILWTILIIFIARIVWRFVHAVMDGAGMLRDSPPGPAVPLVRDPVCGVYVVPSQALTAGSGRSAKYFCSEECRKQWAAK